jgi:hypothetical protein
MDATWIPYEAPAPARSALPASVFAFPAQRKEPLTDAGHVRSAIARFRQVKDVSDADRALASTNIQKAAQYYRVHLTVTSWSDLGAPRLPK